MWNAISHKKDALNGDVESHVFLFSLLLFYFLLTFYYYLCPVKGKERKRSYPELATREAEKIYYFFDFLSSQSYYD